MKNTTQAMLLNDAQPSAVVPSSDAGEMPTPRRKRNVNQPQQLELVLADMVDVAPKDDLASMEIPLYSLSKNKDTEIRVYTRGNRTVRVIPSGEGAANVFDKDLILYVASQLVERINRNLPVSPTVQIETYDFIKATDRDASRGGYENILGMLRRLRGTTIETNIPTGGRRQANGFSLITNYSVLSGKSSFSKKKGEKVERVLSFTVTLSEWIYNGLLELEVLTLDRRYFQLGKAIERKLYEVARKHCGTDKAMWEIGIDLLAEKIGFRRDRPNFRAELRSIIKADTLPEYRMALDRSRRPDMVVFYTRNAAALSKHIRTQGCYDWFNALETKESLTAS
ncbi:replication initiator protein A [Burkholderia multivorans]|uniref:replication initiator protein A n=1 Tax=Burkholderia multivorans TaxID=87883 RepID=UPI001F3352BB|nr:replication initiator protein A [Burkholderia multivorans]